MSYYIFSDTNSYDHLLNRFTPYVCRRIVVVVDAVFAVVFFFFFFRIGESVIATQRAFRAHFMLRRSDVVPDRKSILQWVENI